MDILPFKEAPCSISFEETTLNLEAYLALITEGRGEGSAWLQSHGHYYATEDERNMQTTNEIVQLFTFTLS